MTEVNNIEKTSKTALFLNILALLCGTWFLATGWMWVYLINLVAGYPAFLLGLFAWYRAKKLNGKNTLNNIALVLLLLGLLSSAVTFCLFYFDVW